MLDSVRTTPNHSTSKQQQQQQQQQHQQQQPFSIFSATPACVTLTHGITTKCVLRTWVRTLQSFSCLFVRMMSAVATRCW